MVNPHEASLQDISIEYERLRDRWDKANSKEQRLRHDLDIEIARARISDKEDPEKIRTEINAKLFKAYNDWERAHRHAASVEEDYRHFAAESEIAKAFRIAGGEKF